MKIAEVNPHIRYAMVQRAYMPRGSEFSVCYDCRVFFAERACGRIEVGGAEYEISNGTAVYLPPRSKYRLEFQKQKDFKLLVLNFDLVQSYAKYTTSLGTAVESEFRAEHAPAYALPALFEKPIVKPMAQLGQMLSQCCELFLRQNFYFREHASALLKLCLLEFLRETETGSGYRALCEQVQAYVFENCARAELANTEIAERFNYHPYHLSRILKEETGKTLHQLLTECRINAAKNELVTTQRDIEQIAWRCGFSSASHFIKVFRVQTGVTPKKYRQSHFGDGI